MILYDRTSLFGQFCKEKAMFCDLLILEESDLLVCTEPTKQTNHEKGSDRTTRSQDMIGTQKHTPQEN